MQVEQLMKVQHRTKFEQGIKVGGWIECRKVKLGEWMKVQHWMKVGEWMQVEQ